MLASRRPSRALLAFGGPVGLSCPVLAVDLTITLGLILDRPCWRTLHHWDQLLQTDPVNRAQIAILSCTASSCIEGLGPGAVKACQAWLGVAIVRNLQVISHAPHQMVR